MATEVWYLPFNDKKEILYMPDKAKVEHIIDMKKLVKTEFSYLENVAARRLVVWQCKEPKWLIDQSNEELRYNLSTVDFLDERHVVKLENRAKVVNLKLDKDEILLVQVPRAISLCFF